MHCAIWTVLRVSDRQTDGQTDRLHGLYAQQMMRVLLRCTKLARSHSLHQFLLMTVKGVLGCLSAN